jgi:hypothetical protein
MEGDIEAQREAGRSHVWWPAYMVTYWSPIQTTSPVALSLGPRCHLEDPFLGRPFPGQAPPLCRSLSVAWNSSASDPTSTGWPRAGSATSQSLMTCSPMACSPMASLKPQFPSLETQVTSGARLVDWTSQFMKSLHTEHYRKRSQRWQSSVAPNADVLQITWGIGSNMDFWPVSDLQGWESINNQCSRWFHGNLPPMCVFSNHAHASVPPCYCSWPHPRHGGELTSSPFPVDLSDN